MAEFTKGPWRRDGDMVRGGDLTIVAKRHRLTDDVNAANMNLIAAAPDLYEALEPFVEIDGEGTYDLPDSAGITVKIGERTTYFALTLGDIRRARSALSKADGREG